jgi:hypothetical protein
MLRLRIVYHPLTTSAMSETRKPSSASELIILCAILQIVSPPMMTSRMRVPSFKTRMTRTAPYEHSGIAVTFGPNLSGNLAYVIGALEVSMLGDA